jgi:hypothetical protein
MQTRLGPPVITQRCPAMQSRELMHCSWHLPKMQTSGALQSLFKAQPA